MLNVYCHHGPCRCSSSSHAMRARAHGQTHAFSIATQPLHFAFQASTEIRSVSSFVLREHSALVVLREHAALVNRDPGSRRPALATSTGGRHPCMGTRHVHVGTTAASGAPSALETALGNACGAPTVSNGFQRLPTAQRSFEHGGCDGALETAPRLMPRPRRCSRPRRCPRQRRCSRQRSRHLAQKGGEIGA